MERQSDSELRELLQEWKAPAAPASLERRVFSSAQPWWHVLVYGYIRVPVPVACGLVLLVLGGAWRVASQSTAVCPVASSSPALEQKQSAPCALKWAC